VRPSGCTSTAFLGKPVCRDHGDNSLRADAPGASAVHRTLVLLRNSAAIEKGSERSRRLLPRLYASVPTWPLIPTTDALLDDGAASCLDDVRNGENGTKKRCPTKKRSIYDLEAPEFIREAFGDAAIRMMSRPALLNSTLSRPKVRRADIDSRPNFDPPRRRCVRKIACAVLRDAIYQCFPRRRPAGNGQPFAPSRATKGTPLPHRSLRSLGDEDYLPLKTHLGSSSQNMKSLVAHGRGG